MLTPFLKWVGGKRWLIETSELRVPARINRYIEPFLGGGAVFCALQPQKAILSDLNGRLIECYEVIRSDPVGLKLAMSTHAAKHSDSYYYEERDRTPNTAVARAAQFLYLNRTCFNGIYRENLRGKFNVPRGSKNSVLLETDDFEGWARALSGADLLVSDFEDTIDKAGEGDFIFADPPYTVRHNKNGFVKYNQKIFSWEDQERLAEALKAAALRGAQFVLTNADHEAVRQLYEGIGSSRAVGRSSVVAASPANRSSTTELLVNSFNEKHALITPTYRPSASDHNSI